MTQPGARGAKEIGPLVDHHSYQEAAIGSSGDGQLGRRSVLIGDQPFCRGNKVIEDILLLQLHPRLVPLFAILTAAAYVGRGVNHALLSRGPGVAG